MDHFDKQLNELKSAIQQSSMDASGVEQRLRMVWREQNSSESPTMNHPKKTWRERVRATLPLTLSGATLVVLAAVTTVSVSPEAPEENNEVTVFATNSSDTTLGSYNAADSGGIIGIIDGVARKVEEKTERTSAPVLEDAVVNSVEPAGPMPDSTEDKDDGLSYGEDDEQLFDESVTLGIQTQNDVMELVGKVREEVTNLDGYVETISYDEFSGATIVLMMPVEKLTTFESYLREQDITNTLEVSDYQVQNVSEEVVVIDESIVNSQEAINEINEQLANENISEANRGYLKERIRMQEEFIQSQQEQRAEVIASYDLVDVELTITEWASFWEGHYWQYDSETLGGSIKYNLAKVVYRLIRSSGGAVRFLTWLIIYGILLTPVALIGRPIYRKYLKQYMKAKPPVPPQQ